MQYICYVKLVREYSIEKWKVHINVQKMFL